MRVLYRITSIPSTNPSPIFQEDKNKLNELCLKSFLHAFSDIDLEIIFLADHCSFQDKIKELCRGMDYKIVDSNVGQNQTMLDSYQLACEVDDYVLFQESDYVYNGVIGQKYLEALRVLGLLSPYNHPNFYKDPNLHSNECKVELVADHIFRSTERNTMTWGCHSSLVKENRDVLDREGYLDGPIWYELKARGHELYVPIPSFATHMVRDWLAPQVDWREIWLNLASS